MDIPVEEGSKETVQMKVWARRVWTLELSLVSAGAWSDDGGDAANVRSIRFPLALIGCFTASVQWQGGSHTLDICGTDSIAGYEDIYLLPLFLLLFTSGIDLHVSSIYVSGRHRSYPCRLQSYARPSLRISTPCFCFSRVHLTSRHHLLGFVFNGCWF